MTIVTRPFSATNVVTGIVIIALPVVAINVMPELALYLAAYAGVVALPGYVFLAVMAATGFFGALPYFAFVNPLRGRVAGIGHGLSFVVLVLLLKLSADESGIAFIVVAVAALAFYVWFIIEWVRARRAKRAIV